MSNTIILKHSAVAGSMPMPDDLAYGEIALNIADGRMFAKRPSGEVQEFATAVSVRSFASITGDVGSVDADGPAEALSIKGGSGISVTATHATNEIVVALNNADAATLGGHAPSYFAAADHLHDDRYLKVQAQGGDYYTQAQVDGNIQAAIDNLVNGASTAYDTLKELEAALLDNDSEIAAINSAIATKLDASAYTAADVLTKLKTVDGTTSGLDADLLDGQHGAFYRNAGNLNAGTLPAARLSGIYDIGISGNAATATKIASPFTLSLSGDASGAVTLDGSSDASLNVTVANDSHTHDTRYYEKSVADGRFLGINAKAVDADKLDGHDASEFQLVVPTSQKSGLAVGWYTIAVNTGNRAVARFGVRDTNSGDHQSCIFYASHHYGSHSEITVLHSGRYNGTPIRHIRIKEGGTYDGAMLQVYLDHTSHTVQAFLLGENIQESGWVVKDWIPDGTDPGGVSNFAALTNTAAQINLDNIMDGGMATTGQMFIGGKTTQHKVWHAGNDGSGSGLDADLLDGRDSSDFASSDHLHDDRYLQLTGGTLTGGLTLAQSKLTFDLDHQDFFLTRRASGSTNAAPWTWRVEDNDWRLWMYGSDGVGRTALQADVETGAVDLGNASTISGHAIWHAGNDGSGSSLDADLLDGKHASAFALAGHTHDVADISGLSDAATTTIATIRSGTTAANVGLGNVRNVASYSQSEADGRFVKLTDQSSHVEYSGDGGMIVRTADNNGSFIFQARSSGQAARFTVVHGATELIGDSAGWRIGSDNIWHDGNAPATATRWPSWSEVSGKPTTFSPSSHTHDVSDITGLSDAATTTVATIRSGTTKANVGLGSVRNVASYSQAESDGRYIRATSANGYDGLTGPKSGTSNWIRTTNNGLIPYASGGASSLGTSSWPFNNIHGNSVHVGSNITLTSTSSGLGINLGGRVGYIGSRNTSWLHYQSPTGAHYFYGSITAQNNITAYSDIRVKKNLEVIPDALEKVRSISGYTFDRTDMDGPRQTGVVAQEVEKALPEAVSKDPETGHLHVAYGNMVGLLIEAIKELSAEVDAMKEVINGAS